MHCLFRKPIYFILQFILICHLSKHSTATAKEIVATTEWQLVEEGDTIPKGLHVKIDLETGKKWAKLLEDEEEEGAVATDIAASTTRTDRTTPNTRSLVSINDDEEDEEERHPHADAIKITQLANAQLSADASAKITSQLLEQTQNKQSMEQIIASLDDFEGDLSKGELDYEMMYRTLLSLPSEELKTVEGGFPSKPADDASDEEKKAFEAKIRAIWAMRQELLKKMEEEYLADVTDVIAERIEFLKEYLSNPMAYIRQVMTLRDTNDHMDGSQDLSNIVDVLKDLEFQLTDLDNARDFHSMGGWPLLVALLTDSIHGLEYELQQAITQEAENATKMKHNATNKDVTSGESLSIQLSDDTKKFLTRYQQMVWEVQGLACWAIGTAVKNVDEFHSWALDDFSDLVKQASADDGGEINVLTILIDKLDSESSNSPSILNLSPVDDSLQMRRKYEMYALGSLLRGNRDAIHFFGSYDGPAVVYKMFNFLTSGGNNLAALDPTTVKLVSKIILLADDLVMDVALNKSHKDSTDDRDNHILSSLTTFEWCIAPLRMMNYPSIQIQQKMMESMIHMAPHCSFNMDKSYLLNDVSSALSSAGSTIEDDDELTRLFQKLDEIL